MLIGFDLIKINDERLLVTQVLAQVSHPTIEGGGGFGGGYVTTWDGKAKLGVGPGGIKYNVKIGSPCFGWPETEYLEPEVALKDADVRSSMPGYQTSGSVAVTVNTVSCLGNEVMLVGGDAKGKKGVVVGKSRRYIVSHFSEDVLDDLSIGDKVKIRAEGLGLSVQDFKGELYNMSPSFLRSLDLKLEGEKLVFPVKKVIPAYAMGSGSGGSEAQRGTFSIQSCPPSLVKELGLNDLCIGDIVACQDILMSYGKGYYRGATTVGVVATGASDNAGHGPAIFAIAASQEGKIEPFIDNKANLAKFMDLR
jgi:hypothetical protein